MRLKENFSVWLVLCFFLLLTQNRRFRNWWFLQTLLLFIDRMFLMEFSSQVSLEVIGHYLLSSLSIVILYIHCNLDS